MIKSIENKNIIFGFIILLVFFIKFNFFLNIYLILKNDIHERLLSRYGYCYPMGYGFIEEVKKKYNLKNKYVEVVNNKVFPTSNIFTFTFKKNEKDKKILINYSQSSLKKINRKYEIIYNKESCYLIEFNND